MIRSIISIYRPKYVTTLVYMLQNCEYHSKPYLKWFWRTQHFDHVMYRRQLDHTKAARLLSIFISVGMIVQIIASLFVLYLWRWHHLTGGLYFGLALLISYPIVWAHLVTLPLFFGKVLIVEPKERRMIEESKRIFKQHPAIKIAVAGSYGKTSMKELLLTVLSEGKKVAATPANKNVPISHAQFAKRLSGDEEILILELGEGAPGDVDAFCKTIHPNYGVITGIAPAHLDSYKTLDAAASDIFSLASYLKNKNIYVNGGSELAKPYLKPEYALYSSSGLLDWRIEKVKVAVNGTTFTIKHGKKTLNLHTQLLGKHHLGSLTLAVMLAHKFGLSDEEIKTGIGKTKPFEHRMSPYILNNGWIIDDTYNGNIEGIKAGTELLSELPGQRKLYITPGLVDQGDESQSIHEEVGKLIAKSNPDIVVLMKNSVTQYIQRGLEIGGFSGELMIEPNPLEFYKNLGEFVAAGDVVIMQNDWPDNYN